MTLNIASLPQNLQEMIVAAIADQIKSDAIRAALSDERRGVTTPSKVTKGRESRHANPAPPACTIPGLCGCGCMGSVKPGRTWLPGHDAKNGRYARR